MRTTSAFANVTTQLERRFFTRFFKQPRDFITNQTVIQCEKRIRIDRRYAGTILKEWVRLLDIISPRRNDDYFQRKVITHSLSDDLIYVGIGKAIADYNQNTART